MKKIKIIKDGPYLVSGGIPISEKIITPDGRAYVLKEGRKLPQADQYALCRCGKSANHPFCDGAHAKEFFDGTETASRKPFSQRAQRFKGKNVDLLDDGRCAYLRFCHRQKGNAWELIDSSSEEDVGEAIIAASECPAGRLVVVDKQDKDLNIKYEQEIEILQDPQESSSGPIAVRGSIPLEAEDGTFYELRDRYSLCRCGKSSEKPFCDACHASIRFTDKK